MAKGGMSDKRHALSVEQRAVRAEGNTQLWHPGQQAQITTTPCYRVQYTWISQGLLHKVGKM